MTPLRQIWIIVWKDLVTDLRRKENILSMFFFALLTLLVFTFAAGPLRDSRWRLTPAAWEALGAAVGEPARNALRPLIDKTYPSQGEFLRAVNELNPPGLEDEGRMALAQRTKGDFMEDIAPGILWITFLLAGVLGLDRSFNQEKENGCMDGLLLTPAGRGVLYLGKMTSNALFLLVIMALLLPLFALFFGLPVFQVALPLSGVMLAGIVGITALGTLLGGVVSSLKGKEVLFPLLLFPLLVPILIGVVYLSGLILTGQPVLDETKWWSLVLGFDAVYLIVSFMVFDIVMEA
ncbi:MAG: heme exporter protein CcmB [Deltaproteobacteria bacterium]|nr:heme exporter protein CcmB [Deltaproteobacteria bacterium]